MCAWLSFIYVNLCVLDYLHILRCPVYLDCHKAFRLGFNIVYFCWVEVVWMFTQKTESLSLSFRFICFSFKYTCNKVCWIFCKRGFFFHSVFPFSLFLGFVLHCSQVFVLEGKSSSIVLYERPLSTNVQKKKKTIRFQMPIKII